jgi:hypothetical protein
MANSGQSLSGAKHISRPWHIGCALPEQGAIRRLVSKDSAVSEVPPYQIPNHAMHDEIRTYAALQQQMRYSLREQHPEWVEPDGDSPICNSYERRFAELLALFAESGTRSAPKPKLLTIARYV